MNDFHEAALSLSDNLVAFDATINPSGKRELPEGWTAFAPNPVLAPRFGAAVDEAGRPYLWAEGNGRRECFGCLKRQVHLAARKTYRFRVELEAEGLDDLNRNLVHGVFAPAPDGFNNGIIAYKRTEQGAVGEAVFQGPSEETDAEVRLYFRFSPVGRVRWNVVSLQEAQPLPERIVRIACSWAPGDLGHWGRWLDEAGRRGVDVALLPEAFDGREPGEAQTLDGPAPGLLASKAAQWSMYTCGSFYEQRGDLVFNTAPLFDRRGQLVGAYDKNQLYDPELDLGVTPGVGFPVFSADFGRVGIIICYDSWFSEPVRVLAYKGAELVLFPNAGYDAELMPARAADNGIWLATSSLNCPAGVWDPGGTRAGELAAEPTRFAASSICAYERDERLRMVIAAVDLSRGVSPHWWGGPMLSAPGSRRVRQTLIDPIEDEVAREARRWWQP